MSHSGLGLQGLVRSPLVRAYVTRLRPLRVFPFPAKNRLDAGSPRLGMKSPGDDICKLLRGIDSNQTQVSILDSFMGEVLPDVDVLSTLWASDNVVAPLNTSVIVLVDWGPGFFGTKPIGPILRKRHRR